MCVVVEVGEHNDIFFIIYGIELFEILLFKKRWGGLQYLIKHKTGKFNIEQNTNTKKWYIFDLAYKVRFTY